MDPKAKHGQPLSTLIRRLEAATSRLEDIATSVDSTHPETVAAISTAQATIAENAAAAAALSAPDAAAPSEPLPRSIEDFDKLINDDVKSFVTESEGIGGLVEQQVSQNIQSSRGTS
jgi:adenylyl cyclase-associated protein